MLGEALQLFLVKAMCFTTHQSNRSKKLQHGIVLLGIIDAFVCVHNHHRRNADNSGTLEIAWKDESDL